MDDFQMPLEEVCVSSHSPEKDLWVAVLNMTLRDCQKIHDEMKLWLKVIEDKKGDADLAYKKVAKLQYNKTKIRRELKGDRLQQACEFLGWEYGYFHEFAESVLCGEKRVPDELFH